MDITRLPGPGFVPPLASPTPRPVAGRERAAEPAAAVEAVSRPREPVERVVQGEVLQRPRNPYAPTQAVLNGRAFDAAFAAGDGARGGRADPGTAQRALGAYLSHTREFIQPDLNRGRQVDYFV